MSGILPNRRISRHDRDDFVTNRLTELLGDGCAAEAAEHIPHPPSRSVEGLAAIIPLEQVKAHLRIELEVTDEDAYLVSLEMAARLHTENVLRLPLDSTVGENVKQAMLLLIAHWYRNRETVGDDHLAELPLAYMALLAPERDYSVY